MPFARLIWRLILGGTMVIMTASIGLGVVARYVFNDPLFWTDELARYALVWMTFLGGADLLTRRDGHISVEFFQTLFPRRVRGVLTIISTLFVLAVVVMIGIGGLTLIRANLISVSAALGVPMYAVYGIIPFTALLGAILVIRTLLTRMRYREKS